MMITELKTTSPSSLRAVFSVGQPRQVRIELDIDLIGGDDRSENHWAEIARIIDRNRYYQRLDPACRECDWHHGTGERHGGRRHARPLLRRGDSPSHSVLQGQG